MTDCKNSITAFMGDNGTDAVYAAGQCISGATGPANGDGEDAVCADQLVACTWLTGRANIADCTCPGGAGGAAPRGGAATNVGADSRRPER